LWEVIQNPDNREALSWLGGCIVVAGTGAWAVFKFFAERKKADEQKGGDTNVTQSGKGNVSGRDTNIGRDAIYGADGRQIGQAVAIASARRHFRVEIRKHRNF
jgi:hypothetical protein